MNGLKETSPGVWHTPSTVYAEAAWLDMIAAGEYGPKAQHKMIETLAEHFNAYADETRRECAERARNAIFDFAIGDKTQCYSPMICREIAAQLAERAIMGKEREKE